MRLRPYQQALVVETQTHWLLGHRVVALQLPTGGGKCLGKGTPVLMADGTTRVVEDIRVGEAIMGPDSAPRSVLSLARGREKMYRIRPVKGDPFVCNESHILSLVKTGDKHDPGGQIVNISVRDYLRKSKYWKHVHKGWRAPAIEFPERPELEASAVCPYFLGVWLGDGHSDEPAVTTGDIEILRFICDEAARYGLTTRMQKAGGISETVNLSGTKGRRNPFSARLREIGVWKNKHIPHVYKTGSVRQRLELLAGLIDTDGRGHHGGFDFISKVRCLAEDTAWLARSVGLAAYVKESWKSCNGGPKAQYWRVSISGDCSVVPCRIARKKAAVRRQKKNVRRFGFIVEPLGEDDYFGFELTGDKLFVLGDFTVTHNTPILSRIVEEHNGYVCAVAHRDKLVEQASIMLGRAGIRHDLIASEKTKRLIAKRHVKKLGQCFYVPGARVRVASIDTLTRATGLERWAAQVTLWLVDEGHHVLRDNKWGKGIARFTHPACLGLLLTATPGRPDGKGLGRHADGFADALVCGPAMRWLIDEGYLCDYDVVCPPSDLYADEPAKGSGDYSNAQLRTAEARSHITGDIPRHYVKWAAGKSGITFVGTIETATRTVAEYRALGVSAELITGDTDPVVRDAIFDRAERGELNQIVAVDVISEGVDIPALQVGSFGRLTESHIVWLQQLGRLLRPIYAPGYDLETREGRLAAIAASCKPRALLLDHIGGFANPRLGPPDRPREWSLDRRDKRAQAADDGEIKYRICANPDVDCFKPYPRFERACPFCGYAPEPVGRTTPAQVEGDLQMLTPEALAALRGAVFDPTMTRAQHDAQQLARGARTAWLGRNWENYATRGRAQLALRDAMDRWAGRLHAEGAPDHVIQKRFWLTFGVDVLSAQALGTTEADGLRERIDGTVNSA